MIQFNIIDEPKQQFSIIVGQQRVTFLVWYSNVADRWSFDLSIDGDAVLSGRKIVAGVDLLAPFNLGVGIVFAWPETANSLPTRDALPLGYVRLYHTDEEEVDAAIEA